MGSVVISLDAELGWGFHDRPELPEHHIESGRRAWTYLRESFDRLDIKATWAITGHLFLESCRSAHRGHPAGRRCCTRETASLTPEQIWFARDRIEAVRASAVDHEIGSHGFTHVHFRHEKMSEEFAAEELEASVEAAADCGIELSSFVFPVNQIDHTELLAEHGFTCYRGVSPAKSGRLAKLASATIGTPAPPLVEPRVDEYGLVDVPASLFLFNFEGVARSAVASVGRDPVVKQATKGIDNAVENDGVFHMWCHPHNLRTDRDFERIDAILEYLHRRRLESDLRVETMAEVAERVRARRARI